MVEALDSSRNLRSQYSIEESNPQEALNAHELEETLNENGEYKLSEATISVKPRLSLMSSTLYMDLSVNAKNNASGTEKHFGFRFPPEAPKRAAFYVTHGDVAFGIEVMTGYPQISYMNLSVGPGGAMIGPFSLTEAPNLISIAILFGWVIFESAEEVIKGPQPNASEFFLTLASKTMLRFTPYSAFRNFANLFADTSNKSCDLPKNGNDLTRCLQSAASYKWQGCRPVAKSLLQSGLDKLSLDKATDIDPYVRATLMEELDRVHFSGGMDSSDIAKNIEAAVKEAKIFLKKYGAWLEGKGENKPSRLELHSFLAVSLYLLRKLQTSGVIDGKTLEITGWVPIAFKNAQGRVDFLKTVSELYGACMKSDRIWDFMAAETKQSALGITEQAFRKDPEEVVGSWFRYKNLKELADEISSRHIRPLFGLRKVHLVTSFRTSFEGSAKEKDAYIGALLKIGIGKHEELVERRRAAAQKLPEMTIPVSFLAQASDVYNGLELALRLADKKDKQAKPVGWDFRFANDTPPYSMAFKALYDLELMKRGEMAGKKEEAIFIAALRWKAEALIERVYENHREGMESEIKGHNKEMIKRISSLYDEMEEFVSLVQSPKDKALIEEAADEFRFALMCKYVNEETWMDPSMDAVIAKSERVQELFEQAMGTVAEVMQREFLSKNGRAKKEAIATWAKEYDDAIGRAYESFQKIQEKRNSALTMKLYLEKIEKAGGQNGGHDDQDKRHFVPGWRGGTVPFVSIEER